MNQTNPNRLPHRRAQTETEAFKRWYGDSQLTDENGRPFPVFHGSGDPSIEEFSRRWIWASKDPALASEYAAMRREVHGAPAVVMPLFMRLENPFDADQLKDTVTVVEFFSELIRQAELIGERAEQVSQLALAVRRGAIQEESGPHYSRHNFWQEPESYFGRDGSASISLALDVAGFDGAMMTEGGVLTFGVRTPEQVKSAIGNSGEFSLIERDLRRSMSLGLL